MGPEFFMSIPVMFFVRTVFKEISRGSFPRKSCVIYVIWIGFLCFESWMYSCEELYFSGFKGTKIFQIVQFYFYKCFYSGTALSFKIAFTVQK